MITSSLALLLVLLPAVALAACMLVWRAQRASWPEAVLGGAVLWGMALVAITEGLSLFQALETRWVAAAWCGVAVVGLVEVTRRHAWRASVSVRIHTHDKAYIALLCGLGAVFCGLGLVAVVSPPNTWDSMTYHMARLIHWIQDASLSPYPTHILRQLYLQPGAEFALLHLQLLSGGDHLAGVVQLASLIGVAVGTGLIAGEFQLGHRGRLLAAIFAVSAPICVLEATSTQNDCVLAFWVVCSVFYALRIIHRPSVRWPTVIAFGGSLGLALVTKATAYLILLPFVVWLTSVVLRRCRTRAVPMLLAVGAIALVLNTGLYIRNARVFGSPIGPPDEGSPSVSYRNATLTPQLLASNVIRDLGLNVVATPSQAVNVGSFELIERLHQWLGVDLDDPRTTWGAEKFAERAIGLSFDENFASNPIQLALLLVALAGVWVVRRRLTPSVVMYSVCLIAGFVLFAAVLRWQPWSTRLEVPFFALGGPVVAVVVERLATRFSPILAMALLVSMLPWVAYNQARPLVGPRSILHVSRADQYFTNRPALDAEYRGAVDLLAARQCTELGFVTNGDGWEYPLWALLPGAHIEQVDVANVSAAFASPRQATFHPCAVVAFGDSAETPSMQVDGQTFLPYPGTGQLITLLTPGGR